MRIIGLSVCLLVTALTSLAQAQATIDPPLTKASYEHWRDLIDTKPEEMRWQQIPWRTSFWAGVIDAQKEAKPLLLWIYGGDPLGVC